VSDAPALAVVAVTVEVTVAVTVAVLVEIAVTIAVVVADAVVVAVAIAVVVAVAVAVVVAAGLTRLDEYRSNHRLLAAVTSVDEVEQLLRGLVARSDGLRELVVANE